jgi:hypothetical protein
MQRSLKVLALTIGAAALALALTVPATGATKVLFPSNCGKPTYKPTKIVVTCGDANNVLVNVKWESYGTDVASGKATAKINDCEPNCAAGKVKNYPAVVDLKKPKDCGRYMQFTQLVETFTGAKPPGSKAKVTEKFPCGGNS